MAAAEAGSDGASDTRAALRWSRLSVIAALVVPLAVLTVIATLTYASAAEEARERLDRAARIGQEHAARVVETNLVLARTLLTRTRDVSDDEMLARQETLHPELVGLAQGLRQIQSV